MSSQASTLAQQGWRKLSAGDLEGAVEILSRAIVANDKDADAKALLGMAYSQKGLHAQAVRALQSAVSSTPESSHLRCTLGVVLERAGDLPAAAAAYQQALQVDPQHHLSRQRLQAIAPGEFEPQAAPAAPYPTPQFAETAPEQHLLKPGYLLCARCGQETREGLSCEWCCSPLLPPTAVITPPNADVVSGPTTLYEEPAVAVASIYAREARARESAGVLKGTIVFAVLALGVGYFFFGPKRSRVSGQVSMPMGQSIRINGVVSSLDSATASFRTSPSNSLVISGKGDAGTSLAVELPAPVASMSELAGRTLTTSNDLANSANRSDSRNVFATDGHRYIGEKVSAQVHTVTAQQITVTLDGTFSEAGEQSGQPKATIAVTASLILSVSKD